MDHFFIDPRPQKMSSINRTIRFKPEHFDRLTQISEETGVSFNRVVTQCIEYALEHYRSGSEGAAAK